MKIHIGKLITLCLLLCANILLCSCWQVAAARAAKKRTTQTGYVVGTVENEIGVDDPLSRKQRSFTQSQEQKKAQE